MHACPTIPSTARPEVPSQTQTWNLGHEPKSYLCHRVTGLSAGGVPGACPQGIALHLQHLGDGTQQGYSRRGKERPVWKGAGSRCLWLSRSVWPPWHSASFIDFPSTLTGLWPASFLRPALTIFLLAVFWFFFFLPYVGSVNSPAGHTFYGSFQGDCCCSPTDTFI